MEKLRQERLSYSSKITQPKSDRPGCEPQGPVLWSRYRAPHPAARDKRHPSLSSQLMLVEIKASSYKLRKMKILVITINSFFFLVLGRNVTTNIPGAAPLEPLQVCFRFSQASMSVRSCSVSSEWGRSHGLSF